MYESASYLGKQLPDTLFTCAGATSDARAPSGGQLRALARRLSQAEPGLKLSDATLKQASDLITQATARIEAQMCSGALDTSVLGDISKVSMLKTAQNSRL